MAQKYMVKRPGRLERILIRFSRVGLFAAGIFLATFLIDQASAKSIWTEVLIWLGFIVLAIVLIVGWFRRR